MLQEYSVSLLTGGTLHKRNLYIELASENHWGLRRRHNFADVVVVSPQLPLDVTKHPHFTGGTFTFIYSKSQIA